MLPAQCIGSGPRTVLVHGFTQNATTWQPIADALAGRGHEVLAVDLPGHGKASATVADLEGAAALLGQTGASAAYVGYSLGGRVCLHLALARPHLVRRLVLVGATAGIDDPAQRAARRRADEALADELEAGGDSGLAAWLDRWLARPLFATLDPSAARREERLANTAAGLASSLRQAGTGTQEPLWHRLASLEMPILVVAGQLDAAFSATAQRMAECIGANATFHAVPGAGHAVHLEQPDAFVELVSAFVGD